MRKIGGPCVRGQPDAHNGRFLRSVLTSGSDQNASHDDRRAAGSDRYVNAISQRQRRRFPPVSFSAERYITPQRGRARLR